MAAKQALNKRTSLMLGNDSDETQLVLESFYSRRDEQSVDSNIELIKLFLMTTQADRSGGLRVCGNLKTKVRPKPKQLVTLKHDKRSLISEIPLSPLKAFYLHEHTAFEYWTYVASLQSFFRKIGRSRKLQDCS